MKNADMPAMPIEFNGFGQYAPEAYAGLTKREMIAMHIMAATCYNTTDRGNSIHYVYAARSSVEMADALLKELEK